MKDVNGFSFLRANEEYAIRLNTFEPEAVNRSKFVRDRDRILFSKEFRRLEGKTQVFINGYDDHIRNRMTHTIEVSQIAQSISDYFGFESYLAEAISLGHDVGHTPFGHVGERVLNHLTNNCLTANVVNIENKSDQGFKHNWQGVKVVSSLEKISPLYRGINLTDYTIWGILNHSSLNYDLCKKFDKEKCQMHHNGHECKVKNQMFSLDHYSKFTDNYSFKSWTFEGLIVGFADEIAQRHHDIEDGLIAGIIDKVELVDKFVEVFINYLSDSHKKKLNQIKSTENINYVVHDLSSLIISFYSNKLIENTTNNLRQFLDDTKIKTTQDFYSFKNVKDESLKYLKIVGFPEDFKESDKLFKKYLISRVLNSHIAQTMDGKASHILNIIIEAYSKNPKQLPDGTIAILLQNYLPKNEFDRLLKVGSPKLQAGIMRGEVDNYFNKDDANFKTIMIRTITDFIAGMTDNFAISQYKMLYGSDNFWMR